MSKRFLRRIGTVGIIVLLGACASGPPNLQEALDLYREGQINEARRDLAAYVKAKPFNPESEDARQHILLIRRIKQLESIAIAQWERGNTQGARKIIGIIRILHPVYVDSTEIYQLIDFSKPPVWASGSDANMESLQAGEIDSSQHAIIPFIIRMLDRQERAVITMSRAWEECRLIQEYQLDRSILTVPDIQRSMLEVGIATRELQRVAEDSSPLITEVNAISAKFDDFATYLNSESIEPTMSFDYGFQSHKRDLLGLILHLKSRLVNLQGIAPPI